MKQIKLNGLLYARILAALLILFLGGDPGFAQSTDADLQPTNQFQRLSLEELINQQVTIVSKTPEKVLDSPADVQVVTGEDIERSGATSLPEALRLASNLDVAQVNSHDWAISARGFNNTLANKLLVMIDGRTIYTPLYAGVFWDVQSVLLNDVDRIEVISGPGAALWGDNAVNGVINVISKSARDTQGGYLSAAGGSFLQDSVEGRYGGRIGTNLFYRVYVQRFDHDSTRNGNDVENTNSWDMTQGGFRMDYYPQEVNTYTLQGDFYASDQKQPQNTDTTLDGQNVLARWNHLISEESDFSVQTYVDRTWRNTPGTFAENLLTYDIDFQHHFPLGQYQNVLWGGGYRLMEDHVDNSPAIQFLPADKMMQLFSFFAQDQISLFSDRLKITIGTRVEHNDFSGWEIEPNIRAAFKLSDRQTLWAAVSRAVRSPSRIDTEATTPVLVANPDFNSEKLLAYEVGYRVQPSKNLSASLSSYYNVYQDLRSVNLLVPPLVTLANSFRGEVWGLELSTEYKVTERWRLRGGYDYIHKDLRTVVANALPSAREGNDPANQFSFQSILDLPAHFQFDLTGRYVDTLPSPVVPSYFSLDARLAWTYKNALEFSVVCQNLLDTAHREFGTAATGQEIPRSIYGKVTWRF